MHGISKALIGCGAAVLVMAAVWHPVVEPRVVKLPDNIDRTEHYAGSLVTYLDPSTGATLATPVETPLTIDRHIATVPGETGANVSVLRETSTVRMGATTVVQDNQYAVDRRTMQNVADPNAWSLAPANVTDRSGTYYLNLPMGVDSTGVQLKMWKPEAGASYDLTSTTPATGVAGGTDVVNLKGDIPTPLPVAPYEKAALQAQGFPMQLTPQQVTAKLAAAGIDVAAAAPVLAQSLSADEMATVVAAIGAPAPLNYFVTGSGLVGVEPSTGGLVDLSGVVDRISVQADLTGMSSALAVLSNHLDVPAIATLVATLQQMAAAPPQPVYEMRYTQTPASVATAGSYASSQADKITMATVTIPRTLLAVGILLVLGGTAAILWSRRQLHHAPPVPGKSPLAGHRV